VSGGPTNNGGIIFEWFANEFGDFKNPFDLEQNMEELITEASKVPVGSDGLLFLPYLLGERAPIWNANARGVFFGLNIKHERQHLLREPVEQLAKLEEATPFYVPMRLFVLAIEIEGISELPVAQLNHLQAHPVFEVVPRLESSPLTHTAILCMRGTWLVLTLRRHSLPLNFWL
jgi:hypothetical protein